MFQFTKPHRAAITATFIVLILLNSAINLFAWLTNNLDLTRLWVGPSSMKANTALLFALCAVGLVGIYWQRQKLTVAIGISVLTIATLSILQHIFAINLGIDQALIADPWSRTEPGRMSPGTAFSFCLAGTLLALHHDYPLNHIGRYDFLITGYLAIPLFAFFSYIFAPQEAIAIPILGSMPFHAVLSFLFFFFALGLLTNSKGASGLLNRDTVNGRNFRFLFLLVLILPLCLGSVLNFGVQQDWVGTGVGIAIYCMFTTLIVSSALANSAIVQDHWWKRLSQERQRTDSLESRIHELLEISADGILLVDQDLNILHANSGAERILGYSPSEFLDLPMEHLFSEENRSTSKNAILRFINSSSSQYTYDVPNRIALMHKDGRDIPVAVTLSKKEHPDQTLLIAIIKSIALLDNKIRLLEKRASTDPLTQIPNRSEFHRYLKEQRLREKRKTDSGVAFLMLDIDDFKRINDTYGHAMGDLVLKAFSAVVTETLREEDKLFRIGGEEFVVVTEDLNPSDALAFAERIRMAVQNNNIELPEANINITCSIGICLNNAGEADFTDTMSQADAAMYQAKASGKNKSVLA